MMFVHINNSSCKNLNPFDQRITDGHIQLLKNFECFVVQSWDWNSSIQLKKRNITKVWDS